MLLCLISLITVLITISCAYTPRVSEDKSKELSEDKLICAIIVLICLGAFWAIIYIPNVSAQNARITKVNVIDRQIIIMEARRDDILPLVRLELSKYPEHEVKVFEKYLGNGMFVNLPPELKANTTIMQLAKEIKEAKDRVYKLEIKREEVIGSIYYINSWIWMITPGIPRGEHIK